MEFRRINENTVSCIITPQDMDEQGLVLQDLFEKKKEAMDFLHEVVEKAEEEVDYKPSGEITPMQISILQDKSICITLSENPEAAMTELIKMLSEKMDSPLPEDLLEELGDLPDDNERLKKLKSFIGDKLSEGRQGGSRLTAGDKKPDALSYGMKGVDKIREEGFVFTFESLQNVIEFARHCPSPVRFKSILYRSDKGDFYLRMQRGRESMNKFARIFTLAYEYGSFHSVTEAILKYMEENYTCIIADKAVNRLKKL